jgi:D-serine deaminase-like pyridoxal phosphate-dependent protein
VWGQNGSIIRVTKSVPEDFGLEKEWIDTLMSPALIINEAHVRHNVETIVKKVGGADRWRPHLKTTKMKWVWKILLEAGVRNFKVATTKEAEVMIQLVNEMKSFKDTVDVLVAYPLSWAKSRSTRESVTNARG